MRGFIRSFAVAALAALLLAAAPQLSSAQNLLTNPGFETGDLTGWTDAGNTGWNNVTTVPHTGTFGISNGAVGSLSLLQQTIATIPGATYAMSGWVASSGASHFQMRFDGQTIFPETILPASGYTFYRATGTAIAASTVVEYGFRDDPSFLNFDDASVTLVPEGGSMSLMAAGLVAPLILGIRRRISRK